MEKKAMSSKSKINEKKLIPYLTPLGAWALSLGTSIGWGSLVITSNSYLLKAGPLGSVLGLLAAAVIMMLISVNYHYMMDCVPEAGGAYAYAREAFGYDHGFLTAWFVILTYLAVFWANVTSLPLFSHYFLGDMFRKVRLYSIFGYDVYLGEALLTMAAIVIVTFLLMRFRKAVSVMLIVMVITFFAGIVVCFAAAFFRMDIPWGRPFAPSSTPLRQVVRIACISPWAFIGFENISHGTEEFTFSRKKTLKILTAAVISTTLLYIFITLLSVTAYPPAYDGWFSYISDLGNLTGVEAFPAFYAAQHYLGNAGVGILMLSLLCLIVTSLFGNLLTLSRVIFALSRDSIMPEGLSVLNRRGIPYRALALMGGISLLIPFIGRTAIGWIVDVTTLGATIIYGFVSASVWKTARFRNDRTEEKTGLIGMIIMIGFGVYVLLPSLFGEGLMEPESYFLFVMWAIMGFLFFRFALQGDKKRRFGASTVVWIALLSLILFVSLVWLSQSMLQSASKALLEIQSGYVPQHLVSETDSRMIAEQLGNIRVSIARSILIVIGLFVLSLAVLIINYATMSKRARASEKELGAVRAMAETDSLTGVKSKNAYAKKEEEFNQKLSEGTVNELAVVVCDVNGLKFINDTYGHKAGDEYIRQASRLICELFSHSPVFRVGGDEFVVLLSGRDFENRISIISELNTRVEENIAEDKVVVSVGMAEYIPGKDVTLHSVFERADGLMYQRKKELKAMGAKTR